MLQILLIGLGAGAATALLFASVASGSMLSVALFYLAPLPVLIAAIGWSHWAGLLAVLLAAAALGSLFSVKFLAAYLITVGLPAWWLGYLAMLARPGVTSDGVEWYPPGMLVLWAGALGAFAVLLAIPHFGLDQESFEGALRAGFERLLKSEGGSPADMPLALPRVANPERWLDFLVAVIPPAAAALGTMIYLFNLWLSGRIVRISGRLHRPWLDIPSMRFPMFALGIVAVAFAGSFVPGLLGIMAGIVASALLIAFGALGLAVVHAITRGLSVRGALLAAVYIALVVFGWPILIASMIGLADTAFDFRRRFARGAPPTLPT